MDWALRLLESVLFCCLATLVLFWLGDRMRSVNFDPIVVMPCVGEACEPYVGPHAGSPWSQFTDAIEPRGVTSFSNTNICTELGETLTLRGESAEGVDLIIDLITSRGTATVERADASVGESALIIEPGRRNDHFSDVIRDAFRFGPARGCHPINYKPVFWPLWIGWMLLANLRLLRGRQKVWAAR